MASLGRDLAATSDLEQYIGPPLFRTFGTLLGGDPEAIERAIAAYRERFATVGIFENQVYPGIHEALTALTRAGRRLHLVTIKPMTFATRILDHFDLRACFASIHGPDLALRDVGKEVLIRESLEANQVDPSTATMVGDRGEDVDGARRNGVRSIAVTWGFGSRAELEEARPDRLVASVPELLGVLGL